MSFAQTNTLDGFIGKYPIELKLEPVNDTTGEIFGKYRYQHKDAYLELKGYVYDRCVYFEEFYKNEVTGEFYLEMVNDSLKGKWIGGNSFYEVYIHLNTEQQEFFQTKSTEEYAKACNKKKTGGYTNEHYYINDWWFDEEKPYLEIGFSGGAAIVEEFHRDSIRFNVNVVCGPTYHIAFAEGVAHRIGKDTYECLVDEYDGEKCVIQIQFSEKKVHFSTVHSSFVCGFGPGLI